MKKVMLSGMVLMALAALPAVVAGQEAQAQKVAKGASAKSLADETFVTNVAKGGTAEVQLGKLATEKASRDEVKKFGQRMVDDHTKAGDELKMIAQNKNITLPADIGPKEKALRDRLLKLSGEAFDRAYMQAMVEDHRNVAREFKTEANSGKDSEVKAWAARTLPTIEEHLRLAQDINRAVAVGTSGRK
jgi:putative membrane protein